MTVGEICDRIKAEEVYRREKQRLFSLMIYRGGYLNAYAVNRPEKYPDIYTAFPEFFEKEDGSSWKIMKERIAEYGEKFRMRRNGKG